MRRLLLLALAALAAQAGAQSNQQKSEWELEQERLNWKESEVRLPAWPRDEAIIEFTVSGATGLRYYVDPASLSVGEDGVVRYTVIARSPSGVNNISYEGIRCATSVFKTFAYGNDGRWVPQQRGEWRPIGQPPAQRWHVVLRTHFFCPLREPIKTAAEGVDALRQRVHPEVRKLLRN